MDAQTDSRRPSLIVVVFSVRTGRHDKRSTELPADAAALDASRLIPAVLDHFPSVPLFSSGARRKDRLRGDCGAIFKLRLFHFRFAFKRERSIVGKTVSRKSGESA
jgi:hypothetical protein